MESVSLSGAALGSLLIDPRPWDLSSSLKQSQFYMNNLIRISLSTARVIKSCRNMAYRGEIKMKFKMA